MLIFSVLLHSELIESKGIGTFRMSTTIHCANAFAKCSAKVIINRVVFTKSFHHFLKATFAVNCFLSCCFPLVEKWRGLSTPGEGVKTDQGISFVFLDLNNWRLYYLSSCTSATIEYQIGGIKWCQCHDKDVCVCRIWPDYDWSVGIDSMFCMYHQPKICLFMFWHQAVYGSDIWYWQSLAISSCGQVQIVVLSAFNVFLQLLINQLKKILISRDLFDFHVRRHWRLGS